MASLRFLALCALLMLAGGNAGATTYVVTDAGGHTFQWALTNANTHAGRDSITFNIPGSGTHNIVSTLASPFVVTDHETIINGYSQPGSSVNTGKIGQPWNAVIKIFFVTSATCAQDPTNHYPGLQVDGDRCVVRGIQISNAFCNDIIVHGTDNVVEGCVFGQSTTGVWVEGTRARIGGTTNASRNIVIGNWHGIHVTGSFDATIQGNYIGINQSLAAAPNHYGIMVDGFASGTMIGGHFVTACTIPSTANTIAYNDQDGVAIVGNVATNTAVLSNLIHSNGGLGIDLGDDGVTPNDVDDLDTGPNLRQNSPKVLSVSGNTVSGSLQSASYSTYTIQVFDNSACDANAGEGKVPLAETQVVTAFTGAATFAVTCGPLAPGRFYTATATDEQGNTSEFSKCYPVATAAAPIPATFALHANIPNPFNPVTTIPFTVGTDGRVDIAIFDLAGRKVRSLVSENRAAGVWTTSWDGKDEAGQPAASGVYFCRMNAGQFEATRKIVLLK